MVDYTEIVVHAILNFSATVDRFLAFKLKTKNLYILYMLQ